MNDYMINMMIDLKKIHESGKNMCKAMECTKNKKYNNLPCYFYSSTGCDILVRPGKNKLTMYLGLAYTILCSDLRKRSDE